MATIDDPRHQMIKRVVTQRPGAARDVAIYLWERLASELLPIIGEGGFQSIYSRSIHLASATFPWLVPVHSSQSTETRFESLKMSLEERDSAETREASIALLTIFIDILAALIGGLLTTSILRSAWGDEASDIAAKDLR